MANGGVALELRDIVKVYGEGDFAVNALKGINLTFRKNEFVSILGPSGCGKTTLLNIIGGLDRYTSGDLVIEGKSTKKYTDKDWDAYRNNCIGFVFQSYNLIPHQTVLSNVELALELSGVPSAERKVRAVKMLERVGLKGQEHKKPNQLSGGQMQRVAIARALVNDPEIILADEPTGALDSETSVQIMDLLAEIAKDKLVIMVTHNGELAEKYSTRVIRFLDGEMQSDSDPYVSEETGDSKRMRKPKMGFKTAFALSLKNLFSKRARTILTSVAGSIGIIGVALVLALSNGFNAYMSRMQTDTLSTYPLTISESSVDLSAYAKETDDSVKEKYPELDNVLVHSAFKRLTGMLKTNNLADDDENGFLHYLETNADKELYYAITRSYGFDMNDYFYADIKLNGQNEFTSVDAVVTQIEKSFEDKLNAAMGLNTSFVRQYIPTIEEMPDRDLVLDQYDVLYGELPEFDEASSNKIVLVVDEYNGVADITLMLLGYISGSFNPATNDFTFGDENGVKQSLTLEEIVGKEFYLASNNVIFDKLDPSDAASGGYSYKFANIDKTNTGLEKLTVSGIIREKKNVDGILDAGLAYSPRLTEKVLDSAKESGIVSGFTGSTVKVRSAFQTGIESGIPKYDEENLTLRALGGVDTPVEIKIYAKNFEAKEKIKSVIDDWNELKGEDSPEYIAYSDMMSMMFGMLNTMVNAVTYVLVAFTSISLIVSSVMIGIITYISVVERTKEIGVLRALGAAKGEISNVFNAETFLIGLFAGLLGVGITYLLSIPINIILANLVPEVGKLAVLSPIAAVSLVVISVLLTLIAGLIPARIAAKKDPVIALRSE